MPYQSPHPDSGTEVRRAIQRLNTSADTASEDITALESDVTDIIVLLEGGTSGQILVCDEDAYPTWTSLQHDALGGLGDDDHSQYVLASGARDITGQIGIYSILFDLEYAGGMEEGLVYWNADDGTLNIGMPGGTVALPVGQSQLMRCRNASGTDMAAGSVVRQAGFSGNKPLLQLANANAEATAVVLGVTAEAIANNRNGYVSITGLVRGIDTEGFTPGTEIWLDTEDGLFTETKPDAPAVNTLIGYVVADHASAGVIAVRVVPMQTTTALSDVEHTVATVDGQFLRWATADTRFELANDSSIDHGSISGLDDDDHAQYHTDGRASTWLAANHETTYYHPQIATNQGAINTLNGSVYSGTTGQMAYAASDGSFDWTSKLTHDGTNFLFASGTYVDFSGPAIVKPGTGYSFQLSEGGNARGNASVDLQIARSADSQVASGDESAILGGRYNTVAGDQSLAFGYGNSVDDDYSFALGYGNAIDTTTSGGNFIFGSNNTIDGSGNSSGIFGASCNVSRAFSNAFGYYAKSDQYGQTSFASGRFASTGDAQHSFVTLRKTSTSASLTSLYPAAGAVWLVVPEATSWLFEIAIVGRQTNDDYSVNAYKIEGVISRNTGGNVAINYQTVVWSHEDDAAWSVVVSAATSVQALRVQAGGDTDNTVNWVASIHLTQVTG